MTARHRRLTGGFLIYVALGTLGFLFATSGGSLAANGYGCPGYGYGSGYGGSGYGGYGYCPPASEPTTVTLTPPTDTNPVDTSHTVTATVRDQSGDPMDGVLVRFTVMGSVSASGSCTTNSSGQCTFTYPGPPLPGSDVITAYADTDGDDVNDATEPEGTAAKTWVVPASTPGCKVTYGGRITAANGDKATFGGNATAAGLKGSQNYQDHGPATAMHVKSTDVDSVVCRSDGTASIFGTATVDGAGALDYRIDVRDAGEPGSSDRYRIRLSNGYDSGDRPLEGGNIQIH